ncbi:MAG TPA: alpha/beta fold hydrolase [Acidimicrobiales bacterium]|nr:alpha/beta fold hydrolase [Acidimicrobiales bacterium]
MFRLRHIEIHGHVIAYRLAGEGETILLIHGMAGSSRTWRDVMPGLAAHGRVLAPDLLGHGASGKAATDYSLGAHASMLRDLMDRLGIDRATVVGHSLGGGVAMQLAYQYPDRCDRLVLVSSGGLGREVSMILRALSLPGAELVLPILTPAFVRRAGNALSAWLWDRGIRSGRLAEMWRAYASLGDSETRRAFFRTLRAVVGPGGQEVSASDRLYLTEVMPTLIVWGAADPIIPVDHARAAHAAMPGSRLEIFEGVGHFPQTEAPSRFVEVVSDFVDATPPSAQRARSWLT